MMVPNEDLGQRYKVLHKDGKTGVERTFAYVNDLTGARAWLLYIIGHPDGHPDSEIVDRRQPSECFVCSQQIEETLRVLSHTINSGATLCPSCSTRESANPSWADEVRLLFVGRASNSPANRDNARRFKA